MATSPSNWTDPTWQWLPPNPRPQAPARSTDPLAGWAPLHPAAPRTDHTESQWRTLNLEESPPAPEAAPLTSSAGWRGAAPHDPNDEAYWDQYYNAVPQGGWGKPLKAGTFLTFDGAVIPVDYDPSQDNPKWGVNGTMETAMRRAIRWATDMVRAGKARSFQNALSFAMAQLGSDYQRWRATGSTVPGDRDGVSWSGGLGWDPTKLRYVAYREKYDDNIDYSKPTVVYRPGQNDRAYDERGNPVSAPSAPSTPTPPSNNGNNGNGAGNSSGNGGAPVAEPGNGGAGGGYGPNSAEYLAANPDALYRASLAQQGKTYTPRGLFTNFRQSRMGKALAAYVLLNTTPGVGTNTLDDLKGIIDSYNAMAGSGGYFSGLRGLAGKALSGIDWASLSPEMADNLIKASLGLSTQGLSDVAKDQAQSGYDDFMRQIEDKAIANDMVDAGNYGSLFAGLEGNPVSPFFQRLRQLAAIGR